MVKRFLIMRKLIIKTVAITLAIILVVTAGFYLLLSAFFPSVLGDGYFRANNGELSLKYSEKAYEKSKEIGDLATLTERSIVFQDDDRTVKYAVLFVNNDKYQEYISGESEGYHYYIVGNLCEAQYNKGNKLTALSTAFNNTLSYTQHNPIHRLILISAQNSDIATLTAIKENLQARQDKNQLINNHLSLIEELIN